MNLFTCAIDWEIISWYTFKQTSSFLYSKILLFYVDRFQLNFVSWTSKSCIRVLKVRLRSFQNKNMLWKIAKIACLTKPCFWRTIKETKKSLTTNYIFLKHVLYCEIQVMEKPWKIEEFNKRVYQSSS